MNKRSFLSAIVLVVMSAGRVAAGSVDVAVSDHQAYVGVPIVLTIEVLNADDHETPSIPPVDGLDIRGSGRPSVNQSIRIFGSRRVTTQSYVYRFEIRARRAGDFVIPPFTIRVDGQTKTTEPIELRFDRSETGDLMQLEILSPIDEAFVGQSVPIELAIRILPFVDQRRGVVVDGDSMWRAISRESDWGPFGDAFEEMRIKNQRPASRKVSLTNAAGKVLTYEEFRFEAEVVVDRPGPFSLESVQVIVNYPTELGRRRSTSMFDSFLGGPAPFSGRLAIIKSRPVIESAQAPELTVLPIPIKGRPPSFNGAVGRFQIAVEAYPRAVEIDDPISLNIGIASDAPLETILAPPLDAQSDLVRDFVISDQQPAGIIDGLRKVFRTQLRPRRDDVDQIPPLRFSFFDPDAREFRTIQSDPIQIRVTASEVLDLGPTPAPARAKRPVDEDEGLEPPVSIDVDRLASGPPAKLVGRWVVAAIVVPPAFCLALIVWRRRNLIDRLSTPVQLFARASAGYETSAAVAEVWIRRAALTLGLSQDADGDDILGQLRRARRLELAADIQRYLDLVEGAHPGDADAAEKARREGGRLLDQLRPGKNPKPGRLRKLLPITIVAGLIGWGGSSPLRADDGFDGEILRHRRALRHAPLNPALRASLISLSPRKPPFRTGPWGGRILFATAIATWIGGWSVSIYRLARSRPTGRLPMFLIFVGTLTGLGYAVDTAPLLDDSIAIVSNDNLNVYVGDGEAFGLAETRKRARGQVLQIIDRRGDWFRIEGGWVRAADVRTLIPASAMTGK